MTHNNQKYVCALIFGSVTLTQGITAHADFVADSKGELEGRNFYFNRDFRQEGARDKAEEWAQGLLLRLRSGYTAGTVGVGLDALGMVGLKLDSGDGTAGTGLLPADRSSGGSQDDYAKLGLTAKMKASKTELKVGSLFFKDPVINANDTRLLPQTFRGGLLTSQELAGLTLNAGHIDRIKANSSSDFTEMTGNRIGGTSNSFNFGGGDYQVTPQLTLSAHYGQLENVYQQYYGGLIHVLPLGTGQSLKSDIRYASSREDGSFRALDNTAFGSMFTYRLTAHAFGVGYQRMNGDDPFPYIAGSDPYLVNFIQIGDFANARERSWQLRYDYDFAALGLPGLTFMSRYVSGDNVERAAGGEGKEWERNTDIGYVVQSGALKNLGVKWRNATVRSNFGNDLDENRLIVSYTVPLW
ncbi:OprD family porin [Pseudomonas sp. GD03842]|uniref:OprD family porin n=1 Tax=unclassified Pseudomonas TaxID=196821 RepID=UPI000D37C979|nr:MULTISPECIES: OprD family porin [unclassified Pseudomonas]MDH0745448.1 OprD family porin [Pseudomonas sp. GD03842]RAU45169.1 porin [Pseudomonas sp. RIT 409]RAU51381.1 porin [Pseudomonas sp. RIT 412]